MKYYQQHKVLRNWYGDEKLKYKHQKTKKQKSLFYHMINWFEIWVLIFLLSLISLYIYLTW